MIPTWQCATPASVIQQLKADEFLVVIPSPEMPEKSPFIKELEDLASQNLHQIHHYAATHVGFIGAEQKTPFLMVEWLERQSDTLELRWLLRWAFNRCKALFKSKKPVVFLPAPGINIQHVFAEDLFFSNAKQDMARHHFNDVKIILEDESHSSIDQTKLRFDHQLGYRSWINENPDDLTSIEMATRLGEFAKSHDCHFEVFDVDRLKKERMNLILAVGQASQKSPSRLIILHKNLKQGAQPLTLIGKGITFDTGGINVKPFDSHVNCMKNDMGGASLMAHLFMGLVKSGYQKPIALVIPACENLVGSESMKPGALVKSRQGQEVMIEHTDAEGRLILADAIDYASETLNPKQMIVAATLTTAALRQFTGYMTPVYFADDQFKKALTKAGSVWGEKFTFWDSFLPFEVANRTPSADITNMGRLPSKASIGGGSAVAAHFLKTFTKAPLIHIDIFASCWNWSGDYPGAAYGATGAPYNSLFDTLRHFS